MIGRTEGGSTGRPTEGDEEALVGRREAALAGSGKGRASLEGSPRVVLLLSRFYLILKMGSETDDWRHSMTESIENRILIHTDLRSKILGCLGMVTYRQYI